MDLERTKKSYRWDPNRGDYSKSDVSYERRLKRKKETRKLLLFLLYIVVLAVSIYIIYKNGKK